MRQVGSVVLPFSQRIASSGSPTVADSPMRRNGCGLSRASRSNWQMTWRPRSDARRACASSMTTKRRSPKSRRKSIWRRISMASSDSGVICKMPRPRRKKRVFWDCDTSPCQLCTGMPLSSSRSSKRRNWSLMSAFKGPIYSAPTDWGGSSCSFVMMGSRAASVLPLAVALQINTCWGAPRMTVMASLWKGRSVSQR